MMLNRNKYGKFNWNEFTLIDAETNKEFTIDSDPKKYAEKLQEFFSTSGIRDVFFKQVGCRGEKDDDASTWGPQSPGEIDWSGFEI